MILFGNIVCSIIDLRNIVKRFINGPEKNLNLRAEFEKSTFKRDFSPSNDRVFYWKSWKNDSSETLEKLYEDVCKAIDKGHDETFRKALEKYLDLVIPRKLIKVHSTDQNTLPGPLSKPDDNCIIHSARLSICRCDAASPPKGNNLSISFAINDESLTLAKGTWNTDKDNKYVYAVSIQALDDIQFTEILEHSDESESGLCKYRLGYVNTDGFGSALKRIDTCNPINDLTIDNVVSVAAYKNCGFLYINQKGELEKKGSLPDLVSNLYQPNEKLLYVKSLKDTVLTLSEEGNLRIYSAKDNKVKTIPHVYWTELTSDNDNVILKYRKFEESINKVFTYE